MAEAMTDDLVAFIRARLDEDARDYEISIEHCPPVEVHKLDGSTALVPRGTEWYQRMLRRVEAQRKVLSDLLAKQNEVPAVDALVRVMAREWFDHPDYRPEWRP